MPLRRPSRPRSLARPPPQPETCLISSGGASVDVAAGQLASFWAQGGTVAGVDTLRVQVFDGYDWSAPTDIAVNTIGGTANASGSMPGIVALQEMTTDQDSTGWLLKDHSSDLYIV